MSDIFSRLAQGPGNLQSQDYETWNQQVGATPGPQFQRAATDALRQINPQEYYAHTQPGIGGTDPLGAIAQQQRGGLVESLLGALFNQGVNSQAITQNTGIPTLNPNQMSPQDLAALLQWMQQNHPEALGQVAQQYQNNPDLLHSLLSNKGLLLSLGALGLKFLTGQMGQQGGLMPNQQQSPIRIDPSDQRSI